MQHLFLTPKGETQHDPLTPQKKKKKLKMVYDKMFHYILYGKKVYT